jgi:hypothetical protein
MTRKTGFQRWWTGFQGSELLPIIPPNATIAADSDVSDANRGKTPGRKRGDVWRGFGGKWSTEFRAELADVKDWHASGASVGLQTRIFVAIDVDIEDESVADDVEQLALEIIGPAPVRYRTSSNRRLLLFRIKDGEPPLRKEALRFLIKDEKQAVEVLGHGQQCVVEGPHPKGGEYQWRNGHPCALGPNGLTEITAEKKNKFFAAVRDLLDMFAYPIVQGSGGTRSTGAGKRKKIGDASLMAPDAQHVFDIFAAIACDETTFPTRDAFVAALAAIKGALGGKDFPQVLEWGLNYPGAEADYIEKMWASIEDAEIGYSWLEAWARSLGYDGGAQRDFDDGKSEAVTSDSQGEDNDEIPAGALDAMIDRYVWCSEVERYVDLHTNYMKSGKSFNSDNVAVAAFGRSGIQTAEAEFQNHPKARKAAMTTYRPGQGVFIKDTNAGGKIVPAVNLWRPSLIVPAKGVTRKAVAPGLSTSK